MLNRNGTASDRSNPGADIDASRPIDLAQIIHCDAGNDKCAIVTCKRLVAVIEKFDAAGFKHGGEHGVVDMALAVGIRITQFLVGLQWELV